MSHVLYKQPNGKYAEWSTIVDAFIVFNMTADQYIEMAASEAAEKAREVAKANLRKSENGPVGSFAFEWNLAVNLHNMKVEPDETVCNKCGGECTSGKALSNTVIHYVDFGDGEPGQEGQTMSEGPSDGTLSDCRKCKDCGHSFITKKQ